MLINSEASLAKSNQIIDVEVFVHCTPAQHPVVVVQNTREFEELLVNDDLIGIRRSV